MTLVAHAELNIINHFARNAIAMHDVMNLAGQSEFETTHTFYLAVADDLITLRQKVSVKICCNSGSKASNEKGRQA